MSKLENQENGESEKKKPRGTPFQKGNQYGRNSKKIKKETNLSDYILKSTSNGKLMADLYLNVLKTIKSNKQGEKMSYNGVPVTVELAKSANEWLVANSLGKPSARKQPDEKPKRSEGELKSRLRFLIKKLFKDSENVDAVYAILDREGL